MIENEVGRIVVDASIKVHRALGPGLFESVYERVLAYELSLRKLRLECQVDIPIEYDGIKLEGGFKADIVVENIVIIELKSVASILPVHKKQLQTYLKLSGCKLGFLLNFNANLMKDGIIRCVSNLAE